MRIIDGLKNIFGTNNAESIKPLDIDEDGKQLFKEDIIAFVLEELEKRKNERRPLEQQWT